MADNLKELKELIDSKIGNFGVGSIKATDHNSILNQALQTLGKYTGFPYLIADPLSLGESGLSKGQCLFITDFTTGAITGLSLHEQSSDDLFVLNILKVGHLLKVKDFNGGAMLFEITAINTNLTDISLDITIKDGQTPIDYSANFPFVMLETFEKGGSEPIFESALADGIVSTIDLGEIPQGTDVATLKGERLSKIIEDAMFRTILAYYTDAGINVSLNNGSTIYEVGTDITLSSVWLWNAQVNFGNIKNGDGTNVGDLRESGVTDWYVYWNNVLQKSGSANITSGIQGNIGGNSAIITLGNNNVFSFAMDFLQGVNSGNYTDNKGGTDLVPLIESAILDPLTITENIVVNGYHRHFHFLGNENAFSQDSATIRTYNSALFSNTSSTGVVYSELNIPTGTEDVVFYALRNTSVVLFDNSANTPLAIVETGDIQIEDAGGNLIDYTYHRAHLGTGGYPQDTTIKVTIS